MMVGFLVSEVAPELSDKTSFSKTADTTRLETSGEKPLKHDEKDDIATSSSRMADGRQKGTGGHFAKSEVSSISPETAEENCVLVQTMDFEPGKGQQVLLKDATPKE